MVGRVRAVHAGRPPARPPEGGSRSRASARACRASAIPTTSSTGSPSRAGSCSAATSRTRSRAGSTASRGSTASGRSRPTSGASSSCCAARRAGSRCSPTPRSCKLVCHPDAMTPDAQPLLGPDARGPRLLDGGRALAERVRRRRRNRPDDRRVDHGRRDRARRLRRTAPGGSASAHAIPSTRPRRPARRTATTTSCATRSTRTSGAGRTATSPLHGRLQDLGCGVRREERLGAPRLRRAREAVASRGRRPARVRLDEAAVVRAGPRRARGVPGAGRDHRHDLVRQDRGLRPGCRRRSSSASPTTLSTGRSAASSTRSS